jgi:hypothetical protein
MAQDPHQKSCPVSKNPDFSFFSKKWMLKVEVFPVNAETIKVLLFTTIGAVTGGHKNH